MTASPTRVARAYLKRIAAEAQDDYAGVEYDDVQVAVDRIERGLHPGPYKVESSVFADPSGTTREFVVMDRNRKPVLGEPWGDGSANPLRFDSKREAERFIRDIPAALGTSRRAATDVLRLMKPVLDRIEKDMTRPLPNYRVEPKMYLRPGETVDALVMEMDGKEIVFYPTDKAGMIATNIGQKAHDKAGVRYRFMKPMLPSDVEAVLRALIPMLMGSRALEPEESREPAPSKKPIWSVAVTGRGHGYVTEVEANLTRSEAEEKARNWGGAYVVKGTQMWNEPIGQVEEHNRDAPYKFIQ